jgi:cobalt-zinc-cadmium efflux system membrane fusion protein
VARILTSVGVVAVALVLACIAGAFWMGVLHLPSHERPGDEGQEAGAKALDVELVKDKPHTLYVPEPTREALGIRKGKTDQLEAARRPTKGWPLVLPGSTMLDPARVLRIRARFAPAEVVSVHKVPVDPMLSRSGTTEERELRPGDKLKKGEVLGVFYSVDVGSQKNNLFDAVVQLKLDNEILQKAEKHPEVVPEAFILQARRNVQGDYNNINKAENTLRAWNIPEEEIRAVRREAEQASESSSGAKTKVTQDQLDRWARVTLRTPDTDDGIPWTLIERNVVEHEIVVDNTTNLFVLAKVDRLTVLAYAPEDDLPTLENLSFDKRRWTIHTAGAPAAGIEGPIDEIGYIIDPNQHTAVLKGHIDNPGDRLRGGQYISCTINLDPPRNAVEIPMSAVVDDGKQTVVFVQEDANKPGVYTLRRVKLTHRFDKTAFVRSDTPWPFKLWPLWAVWPYRSALSSQLPAPLNAWRDLLPWEPLAPGERVIKEGALELKKELEDREANPGAEKK